MYVKMCWETMATRVSILQCHHDVQEIYSGERREGGDERTQSLPRHRRLQSHDLRRQGQETEGHTRDLHLQVRHSHYRSTRILSQTIYRYLIVTIYSTGRPYTLYAISSLLSCSYLLKKFHIFFFSANHV